jgi:4-hydroxy-tetrahydrodipicolinate reductase
MNFVLLGAGKTGSIVAEIARERGHQMSIIEVDENLNGSALTRERLAGVDAVIDFTNPHAVMANIEATVKAGCNMVVGTTGWYDQMDQVKQLVEANGTGFLWASNFSIGMNLFFDIVRAGALALNYGYEATIMERHHIHKKDKPSGTAISMNTVLREVTGKEAEINSVREGETVGMHVLMLDSAADTILLTHDAKNRRGLAEGAVRAAEWVKAKRGFFEFKQVFRDL